MRAATCVAVLLKSAMQWQYYCERSRCSLHRLVSKATTYTLKKTQTVPSRSPTKLLLQDFRALCSRQSNVQDPQRSLLPPNPQFTSPSSPSHDSHVRPVQPPSPYWRLPRPRFRRSQCSCTLSSDSSHSRDPSRKEDYRSLPSTTISCLSTTRKRYMLQGNTQSSKRGQDRRPAEPMDMCISIAYSSDLLFSGACVRHPPIFSFDDMHHSQPVVLSGQ